MRLARLLQVALVIPSAVLQGPSAAPTPTPGIISTVTEWNNEPDGYRGYVFGTRFQGIAQKERVLVKKPDPVPNADGRYGFIANYSYDPTNWTFAPDVDLRTNERVWKCNPDSLESKHSRLCGRLPLRPEEIEQFKKERLEFDGKDWYQKDADGKKRKQKKAYYNPLPAEEGYHFTDDKLVSVVWRYTPEDFPKVADVLVARYGPPTGIERENVTNKMGAAFENVTYTWLGKRFAVRASRFQSDLDAGLALFTSTEVLKARAREEEERKRKAVKVF